MSQSGAAQVELAFARDEGGRAFVEGRVQAQVELRCQRCLEPMSQLLDAPFRLGLVADEEEAECLPPELEPLMLSQGPMVLAALIEDELLLALPIVALHQAPHPCADTVGQEQAPAQTKRENPFAVLAQLKRDSS